MTNQEKLKQLISTASITQREAAELIAAQTSVPCSERAVRSWLADSEKSSARSCPEWAILALEKKLKTLKKI